jgi:hypothetical protein
MASQGLLRVVVLGAGRCGTVTFARACSHLDNYSSSHESRIEMLGPERVAIPRGHVEVDNRLVWRLGMLASLEDTLFVHMRRDVDATAQSFVRRWDSSFRSSIMRAYAHGIVVQEEDWTVDERLDVARDMVRTVHANVDAFLDGRDAITVELEAPLLSFDRVLERMGATGDLAAARAEWGTVHNASRPTPVVPPRAPVADQETSE